MKKTWLIILVILFCATTAYSAGWDSGSSGVSVSTECNADAYYAIGKLCQDSDDGKLYKGTGAAVSEITSTDLTAPGTIGGTTPSDFYFTNGYFFQSGVEHGITSIAPTNDYGAVMAISSTIGGLDLYGITDADQAGALRLTGILGAADPTDIYPAVVIRGGKKNGTGWQALADAETVLMFYNYTSPIGTVYGNGQWILPSIQGTPIGDVIADIGKFTVLQATTGIGGPGSVPITIATGTADAIVADYNPDVTLVDKALVALEAAAANATTTPTFAPDGVTAHTIVKQGGVALAAGDIPGAGAVMLLEYNLANTRWELLNPAKVALTALAPQAAYTILANGTAGAASPTAIAPVANGIWGCNGSSVCAYYTNFRSDNTAAQFNDSVAPTKLAGVDPVNVTAGVTVWYQPVATTGPVYISTPSLTAGTYPQLLEGVATGGLIFGDASPDAAGEVGYDGALKYYDAVGLKSVTTGYIDISTGGTTRRIITVDDAAQTMARRDAGQTFTGVNVFTAPTFTTSITPTAHDGTTIGTSSLGFSDIYLAAGAVIYAQDDESNTMTSAATGWTFAKPITVADVTNDNYIKITNNSGGRAPTASVYELYPDAGAWKANANGVEYNIPMAGACTALASDGVNTALTVATTNCFTLTVDDNEDQTITFSGAGYAGQEITIIFTTAGTADEVITFHATLVSSTGTLTLGTDAGKFYVVRFISNGTHWYEVSRTAVQT
ncbi:MAG: hypothetical protein WC332_00860 [Clostridia bacterium]